MDADGRASAIKIQYINSIFSSSERGSSTQRRAISYALAVEVKSQRIESSIEVRQPPRKVYAMVADPAFLFPNLHSDDADKPLIVGQLFSWGSVVTPITVRITELKPELSIAWESEEDSIPVLGRWYRWGLKFQADGGGTRVTSSVEYPHKRHPLNPFVGILDNLGGWRESAERKALDWDLSRIAKLLDSGIDDQMAKLGEAPRDVSLQLTMRLLLGGLNGRLSVGRMSWFMLFVASTAAAAVVSSTTVGELKLAFAMLPLCLTAISVLGVGASLWTAVRATRLLRGGALATAKVVRRQPSAVTTGGYLLTLEYTDADRTKRELIVKTTDPGAFAGEKRILVLYDRDDPSRSLCINEQSGLIKINEFGNLEAAEFSVGIFALPCLALTTLGWCTLELLRLRA